MNEQLRQLKELTTLDSGIVQVQEQLVRYPAMLARLEAAEAALQKAIAETDAALEAALHERRKAEKEIATLETQIKRYHDQQAAVKTNKEYQAITAEIEGLRGKIDGWETVTLEKLEAEEGLRKRKKSAAEQLAGQQKENEAERRRIQGQIVEKQERSDRQTGERRRRLAELDEDMRGTYEHLNQKFPGSAVVPIEGETCGGCHWTLVAQTRQQVRAGKELIRCEHCHRFLFLPGNE